MVAVAAPGRRASWRLTLCFGRLTFLAALAAFGDFMARHRGRIGGSSGLLDVEVGGVFEAAHDALLWSQLNATQNLSSQREPAWWLHIPPKPSRLSTNIIAYPTLPSEEGSTHLRRRFQRKFRDGETSEDGDASVEAAVVVTTTSGVSRAHAAPQGDAGKADGANAQGQDQVHVCFCWGDRVVHLESWQPLLVAMNSTLVNTRDPTQIFFHIVTRGELANSVKQVLSKHLPHAQAEVHFDDALESRIASFVTFRTTSGARKALATPFNFAPFYLDAFLGDSVPRRLIYLDTDVVIQGDIRDLHSTDLHGHAVAAVEDCAQRFEMYIDFKVLQTVCPQVTDPFVWPPAPPSRIDTDGFASFFVVSNNINKRF